MERLSLVWGISLLVGCLPATGPAVARPAPDPSTREPSPGRPVFKGNLHLDLATRALSARWRITYLQGEQPSDSIAFLLNDGLEVTDVSGEAIRELSVKPGRQGSAWRQIVVHFADRVDSGARVELLISYAGTPRLPADSINQISTEWVELSLESDWFPLFASFDQQLTGTLDVEGIPDKWDAVASGAVSHEDGKVVIRSSIPLVDVAFVAAPSLKRASSGRFTVYDVHLQAAAAQRLLDAANSCARYLNARFADHDSLPRGKLVIAPRKDGSYARKNYMVLTRPDRLSDRNVALVLCHELSHYWSSRANAATVDNWLNEGFAEYVAARYLRDRWGQPAFDRVVGEWKARAAGQPPVWTPETTDRGSFVVMYRKAPYLLQELEQELGTPLFDRLLHRYMTEDIRTTRQLLAALESLAGPTVRERFQRALGS